MALDLAVTYPGQVAVDGAYPQGKAQNVVIVGDGIGTPWEADLVNDILGLLQSLLDESGISPSGDPDEVGTSDYLDALKVIIEQEVSLGDYDLQGDLTFTGDLSVEFALTMEVGSLLTVSGLLNLGGTDMTLTGPLIASGQGRLVKRCVACIDAVGPTDYGIGDGDFFYVNAGGISQASAYTLNTTGVETGDVVEFATRDQNWVATFAGYDCKYAAGERFYLQFIYTGSTWLLVNESYYPAA
jgi:hypothetical protein